MFSLPSQLGPILVATSHKWGELVCILIERFSVPFLLAQTHASALQVINSTSLRGIILDGDWAIANGQDLPSVFEVVQHTIPTVTMMRNVRTLFHTVYHPPFHQFCTIPFDVEELEVRIIRSGMLKNRKLETKG